MKKLAFAFTVCFIVINQLLALTPNIVLKPIQNNTLESRIVATNIQPLHDIRKTQISEPHLLAHLYNGFHGDNFVDLSYNISTWVSKNNIGSKISETDIKDESKHFFLNPSFFTDTYKNFNKDGKITAVAVSGFSVNAATAKPYDEIIVVFTSEFEYGHITFAKGLPYTIPACLLYSIINEKQNQDLFTSADVAVNIGLCFVGVGQFRAALAGAQGLQKAYLSILGISEISLAFADIGIKTLRNEIGNLEEGKQFLDDWDTFYMYSGAAFLSASTLETLAIKIAKKGTALKQTATLTTQAQQELDDILNKVGKVQGAGSLVDDFINGLLDANKYIQEGKFIPNVKKIDLMGGKTSQLGGDFANIDLQATKGINGDASKLSKYIQPNSIDEIIVSNPFPTAPFAGPKEFFLTEASKVMKPGTTLTVNGTINNKFFKNVKAGNIEDLGFEIIEFQTPLKSQFQNMKFYQVDGVTQIPNSNMLTTIIRKK